MSAVELGVFTLLAAGALDGDAVRQRLGLDERGARDFLDALVALGLLQRDGSGLYGNVPDADLYLDSAKATYIGGLFDNLAAREYALWGRLTQALRTGEPQTGFEAKEHFATLYSDPKRLAVFAKGMTGASLAVARAMAQKFPWRQVGTVIDIGAAEGCLPVQVALAHPHVSGGGFDLAPLAPAFNAYVSAHGLSDRLRFHSGDFFADPLPSADVLVMGRVLHNWDLATKRMLLHKAYAALPPGGAIIVYERLIDDRREIGAAPGLLSSLNMLIMTAGGFDVTAADGIGWLREAGFQDIEVEPLVAGHSMIVARK
jgi:hypothetical protein